MHPKHKAEHRPADFRSDKKMMSAARNVHINKQLLSRIKSEHLKKWKTLFACRVKYPKY